MITYSDNGKYAFFLNDKYTRDDSTLSPGRLTDKFCSNNCKSAYRRKSGVDNEERICKICGEIFITNKYSKAKVCSKKCSAISRIQTMQSKVC